ADMGSIVAAVFALKHDVNLLIVNGQAATNQANLLGAQVFALEQTRVEIIDTTTTTDVTVNAINAQIAVINADIATLTSNIATINAEIVVINTEINTINNRPQLVKPCVVASLPTPTLANANGRGLALDSTVTLAAGIGNVVVGGGFDIVPV